MLSYNARNYTIKNKYYKMYCLFTFIHKNKGFIEFK